MLDASLKRHEHLISRVDGQPLPSSAQRVLQPLAHGDDVSSPRGRIVIRLGTRLDVPELLAPRALVLDARRHHHPEHHQGNGHGQYHQGRAAQRNTLLHWAVPSGRSSGTFRDLVRQYSHERVLHAVHDTTSTIAHGLAPLCSVRSGQRTPQLVHPLAPVLPPAHKNVLLTVHSVRARNRPRLLVRNFLIHLGRRGPRGRALKLGFGLGRVDQVKPLRTEGITVDVPARIICPRARRIVRCILDLRGALLPQKHLDEPAGSLPVGRRGRLGTASLPYPDHGHRLGQSQALQTLTHLGQPAAQGRYQIPHRQHPYEVGRDHGQQVRIRQGRPVQQRLHAPGATRRAGDGRLLVP